MILHSLKKGLFIVLRGASGIFAEISYALVIIILALLVCIIFTLHAA
ncbi:MAG: hypothetical protein ISS44_00735 [Candidatus Omnitrophica bacterium]|nr:hypothetical protein [Candidatus Omnitrophota bacterium]